MPREGPIIVISEARPAWPLAQRRRGTSCGAGGVFVNQWGMGNDGVRVGRKESMFLVFLCLRSLLCV